MSVGRVHGNGGRFPLKKNVVGVVYVAYTSHIWRRRPPTNARGLCSVVPLI